VRRDRSDAGGVGASNPDLNDKPDLVAALVERIRKFGK
jgi:hypothetical protein